MGEVVDKILLIMVTKHYRDDFKCNKKNPIGYLIRCVLQSADFLSGAHTVLQNQMNRSHQFS